MAQPPYRVDALEIVGDSGVGSRLIESHDTDGTLLFTDSKVTDLALYALTGIQQVGGVIVLGKSGSGRTKDANGDEIDTFQKAFDAVPSSSSPSSPWVILAMPGVYIEDTLMEKNGVEVVGLGNVVLRNATAGAHTLTFVEGPFSVPEKVQFRHIRIENTSATEACVRMFSGLFATGTTTVATVPFVGDTLSIAGTTLTAIANGGTPVAGEFELGTDTATTATNIATAINDPLNLLTTTVQAFASASVVTIKAFTPGLAGNTITLATSVPIVLVLSAATLAGGVDSVAGSTLAGDRISFVDCDLVPTGATGFHLLAESVGRIYLSGGNSDGASSSATIRVRECVHFEASDVDNLSLFDLRYDTVAGGPIPSVATSSYTLTECEATGALAAAFDGGVGSLTLTGGTYAGGVAVTTTGGESFVCTGGTAMGSLTLGGAGPASLNHVASPGALSVLDTVAAVSRQSDWGSVAGAGTATLDIDVFQMSVAFVAAVAAPVVFPVPMPDTAYHVYLDSGLGAAAAITDVPGTSARTVAGLSVDFGAAQTTTVGVTVRRK